MSAKTKGWTPTRRPNVFTDDEIATISVFADVPSRVVTGIGWLAALKQMELEEVDSSWAKAAMR
jgi:hypothetical protein